MGNRSYDPLLPPAYTRGLICLRIIVNQSKVSLNQKRQRKDWLIRHIPVKVKGRSPRPYRVPKLISSIVMGVCLYLAVHLNAGPRYQVCIFYHVFIVTCFPLCDNTVVGRIRTF